MASTAVAGPQAEFGKYLLLRKLAQGGMAEIFLANQRGIQGFEKLVVVKRVLPDLSASDDFIEMFLDEARIAARLEHPNIVRIYELGEVSGQYYIAMEYIAGEDQASVVQQARRLKLQVPLEYAADVVIGAAEALAFAHEMEDMKGNPLNLVHRDVSPSNIIFTWQGGAKLVDFGIARAESNVSKTEGGRVKGKIQYLAPEQCRGERADGRSDLFALGAVLFELITGKRLFQRDNPLFTMNAILKGEVPALETLRPGVPHELEQVMRRALMTDPELRYPSGAELAADLSVYLASTGWTRGHRSVEFLTRLFGEERRRAKLKVARGQLLDEAGYAALEALPQGGRANTGEFDAQPSKSGKFQAVPPVVTPNPSRPAAPITGSHAAEPRPSHPVTPLAPAATAMALAANAPPPSSAARPAPRADLEILVDDDDEDGELMQTVAGTHVTEMLRRSVEARGGGAPSAAAPGPPLPLPVARASAPVLTPVIPVARPSAPVPAPVIPVARPSAPVLTPVAAPPGLAPPPGTRTSSPRLPPMGGGDPAAARPPLAPPPGTRTSSPRLPSVGGPDPAAARPPLASPSAKRASYSSLPAVPAPSAFEQLHGEVAEGPGAAFQGDLEAARAALFGEVPQREGALAPPPPAAAAPGPVPEPVPRPRPSKEMTEAAAALAARIKSTSSSPSLQPVAEPKPYVPPRASPLRALLWAGAVLIALGGLGTAAVLFMPQSEPPVEPAPPPPEPAPAPRPALQVGALKLIGVPPGAKVTVDGNVVADPGGENYFGKGLHHVVVEAKGLPKFERTVELADGEVKLLSVELKKPALPKKK